MFAVNSSKRVFWIMVVIFFGFYAGNLLAEDAQKDSNSLLKGQQKVEGTITKVRDDLFYVKIKGSVRQFTGKEAKRDGIETLNVGDRVQLTVNSKNEIVGIAKLPK